MRVLRPAALLAAIAALLALPAAAGAATISTAAGQPRVASGAYARAQVAPMVALLDSLPHGRELSRLKLYVGTDAEIAARCGPGTMACYDPVAERMAVSGQSAEVAGIPREAVIAHEYGHHVANNRAGGIWSAFAAGTPRWSTYERVCESKRAGQAYPGNQGGHYWDNPGEAFAQTYSQLVLPREEWNYSPLFRPDATALRKLREDVLHPVRPRRSSWQVGGDEGPGPALGTALVADGTYARSLRLPYDGRVRVRVRGEDGARFRAALVDPASDATVASAAPGAGGVTRLRFADCGHRELRLEVTPLGVAAGFRVELFSL
jgi:hypothetical protein